MAIDGKIYVYNWLLFLRLINLVISKALLKGIVVKTVGFGYNNAKAFCR
jgi:hypothetical protein